METINSDIFDASSKSLLSLFNSAEALFQVPVYQRPYRWTRTEVDELWNDIYEAFTNNKEDAKQDINYFLGSIITVPDKKTGYKDIVDGQQRITTLMIMFNMIFKIFPVKFVIANANKSATPPYIEIYLSASPQAPSACKSGTAAT